MFVLCSSIAAIVIKLFLLILYFQLLYDCTLGPIQTPVRVISYLPTEILLSGQSDTAPVPFSVEPY